MRSCLTLYRTGREIPETDRVYWTLSALLARRFYPPTTLFADRESAARLLKWGIKFDEVDTDTIPKVAGKADAMCWSAGKLAAMRSMAEKGKPFLHIDGDAFIFRPLPEALTSAAMFAQGTEKYIELRSAIYKRNTHYPLRELLPSLRLPKFMALYAKRPRQRVINMGLFGGRDCAAIFDYADISIKTFVDNAHNRHAQKVFHRSKPHWLGVAAIAEQWALGAYCDWKRIEPDSLLDRIDSFNINRAHEIGYVHLYSAVRKLRHYRHWAERKLEQERHTVFLRNEDIRKNFISNQHCQLAA
jgi:hypothetical protein